MRLLYCIICLYGIFHLQSYAKKSLTPNVSKSHNTLTLIMAGDALLHSNVYKDAEYNCQNPMTAHVFSTKRHNVAQSQSTLQNSKIQNPQKTQQNLCYDFTHILSPIAPLISSHDLAFYNQETILGGKEIGLSSYPTFNSPQEFGDIMVQMGFNLISLANNHTLDRGEIAIANSLQYWRNKNVLTAGSYESFADRQKPRILEKNGITYTMLAYTYGTNGIPIPKGKEYLVNVYTKDIIANDIKNIRDKVDLLIVSMHWGIEYSFMPTKEQEEMAKFLAQQGVDIVIGNHSHVIAPIEFIDNTLILYSLGNMISAQKGLEKKIGMLVSVKISKDFHTDSIRPKIAIQDIRMDLIYTYYNDKRQDFRIYPFSHLNDTILPNYRKIYKDYIRIAMQRDSAKRINIGIIPSQL